MEALPRLAVYTLLIARVQILPDSKKHCSYEVTAEAAFNSYCAFVCECISARINTQKNAFVTRPHVTTHNKHIFIGNVASLNMTFVATAIKKTSSCRAKQQELQLLVYGLIQLKKRKNNTETNDKNNRTFFYPDLRAVGVTCVRL